MNKYTYCTMFANFPVVSCALSLLLFQVCSLLQLEAAQICENSITRCKKFMTKLHGSSCSASLHSTKFNRGIFDERPFFPSVLFLSTALGAFCMLTEQRSIMIDMLLGQVWVPSLALGLFGAV